jgi:hypothetical protein
MNGSSFQSRTLYTDNLYTSVPLAEELLDNSTHLCATIRSNRKFLPAEKNVKQKQGDVYKAINPKGVKYIEWTDKRPVHMITLRFDHSGNIIIEKMIKLNPIWFLTTIMPKRAWTYLIRWDLIIQC